MKKLLLPGGIIAISFSGCPDWLQTRIMHLMDSVFDFQTSSNDKKNKLEFLIYINGKKENIKNLMIANKAKYSNSILTPTDNWPFLYMRNKTIPMQYSIFIIMIQIKVMKLKVY